MRTKTFTFQKTKRIKVTEVTPAICVDLTVKEAADLVAYLKPANTPDSRFMPLLEALRAFTTEHGVKSDLKPGDEVLSFRMVKA